MDKYLDKLTEEEEVKNELVETAEPEGFMCRIPSRITSSSGRKFNYLMNLRPFKDVEDELFARANGVHYSAITITYKPQHRDNLDEQGLRHLLVTQFSNLPEIKHYTLFPDVDDAGNFHYHGVVEIRVKDRPKVKRILTERIGFIKIEYITDPVHWCDYCRKDKGFETRKFDKYKNITKNEFIKTKLQEPIYTEEEIVRLLVSDIGRYNTVD